MQDEVIIVLEPFIWMFKTKNFSKRYFQLLLTVIIFLTLAVLFYLSGSFLSTIYPIAKFFLVVAVLLSALLTLLIQGYFWELTAKIISRDVDIEASNIYTGKIEDIFIIELPEFKPIKFIWRGVASVVASILMFIPFILLVLSAQYTEVFLLPYDNIEFYKIIYMICYNIIYFCFFALIPAMLWNYAEQNSVVAVWNLRKATYLFETYSFRYIINTVLFIVFYLLNYYILSVFLRVSGIYEYLFKIQSIELLNSVATSIGVIIFLLLIYIIYLYSLHVYAYLLGTIAPHTED